MFNSHPSVEAHLNQDGSKATLAGDIPLDILQMIYSSYTSSLTCLLKIVVIQKISHMQKSTQFSNFNSILRKTLNPFKLN